MCGALIVVHSLPAAADRTADLAESPPTVNCLETGIGDSGLPSPRDPCALPLPGMTDLAASATTAAPAADPILCESLPEQYDRCPTWVATYDHPGGHGTTSARGHDRSFAGAVDPAGERFFVTGASVDQTTGVDAVTVAYDLDTGEELWAARYDGPADADAEDAGFGITVSPDGQTVYVTGVQGLWRAPPSLRGQSLTIAYDAADGAQKWVATHDLTPFADYGIDVAVSPDGSRVFVAGTAAYSGNDVRETRISALALDAGTGATLWSSLYYGGSGEIGLQVAVTPDARRVVVLGTGWHHRGGNPQSLTLHYTTLAFASGLGHDEEEGLVGGEQLWAAQYTGPREDGDGLAQPFGMALSPDGSRVFVTGGSERADAVFVPDLATVAYEVETGQEAWVARLGAGRAVGLAVTVDPDGSQVFVAGGRAVGASTNYVTVAYEADTGARRWERAFSTPDRPIEEAWALAVSPDGHRLYVTGRSVDPRANVIQAEYATVAYRTTNGQPLWVGRHNVVDRGFDHELSIAAGRDRVAVAGTLVRRVQGVSPGGLNEQDFEAWAYDA